MKQTWLLILLALTFTFQGFAQVPAILSHNGFLTDSSGSPLNTTVSMTFRLLTDSLAGIEAWHQAFPGVVVRNGVYQVNFDVAGVNFDQQYWLQTEIGSSVLAPRMRMTSSPHALSLHLPFSGSVVSSARAVTIANSGSGGGMDVSSNGTGIHVVSASSFGVMATSTNNNGVYGASVTDNGMYGSSDSVSGVYGWSLIDAGVYGTNAGSDNFGYLGGPTYGAYGGHPSNGNFGYLGGGGNAAGGYNAGLGAGVRGECVSGFGVYGINGATGNFGYLGSASYGVYGKSLSTGGYAGYFDGNVSVNVLEVQGGSDLAEPFEMENEESIEPGSLVVLDEKQPEVLKLSSTPYDRMVVGVVSGAGGIHPGLTLTQKGVTHGKKLVAIAGRVYCRADAINGKIRPGDLLVTSPIPGCAMKAVNRSLSQGAVIGKAMSGLARGRGLVLILVNLQ